mgnify:CR=1 FL=1
MVEEDGFKYKKQKATTENLKSILILGLFLLSAGCIDLQDPAPQTTTLSGATTTTVTTVPFVTTTLADREPSLTVTQEHESGTVYVERMHLPSPGYAVVHVVEDGNTGRVVGHTGLFEGTETDHPIMIEDVEAPKLLSIMLHYDDGDGVYE